MSLTPLAGARVVCESRDWKASNLEIQKLLYLAHMLYLGQSQKPLIVGGFEAWDYGPVIPSLYHTLKMFGSSPVRDVFGREARGPAEEEEFIKRVSQFLKDQSPGQLIELTHRPKGAWAQSYRAGVRGTPIPAQAIISEYRSHVPGA